jgi:hypothetical protein
LDLQGELESERKKEIPDKDRALGERWYRPPQGGAEVSINHKSICAGE